MPKLISKNNYINLSIIVLISLLLDIFFINNINYPPAWDQGYHLTNLFKMSNILDDYSLNIVDKFNQLLNVTDNYRGPLTYFLSAIFLKFFKNNYHYAFLSNQIFNIICIISIFNIGKIFRNQSTGIWASVIFTFSSLVINQRSDYLIDLSLTSFSTLNLFFFTKWYFDKEIFSKFSILSGISLGLIFLIKPTGIILFSLPFLLILLKLVKNKNNFNQTIKELFAFTSSFLIIIFPWFTRNWLTIITSTINAWNWGIKYQEGLEPNSIEGWTFYLKNLPLIFGKINFSIFSILFLLEKLSQNSLYIIKVKKFNKVNLWFLVYFINCYLVVSLMSTKDIRFILPLYPLLCIYLSIFLVSKDYKIFSSKTKKIILIISISISLLLSKDGLIFNSLKEKSLYKWPHSDIVNEIKKENPNLISTLAILPDTREINTFNLEAEASRQGEYVVVRQVVSNKETYKEDLKYFDWFLVKTDDQGVMSNESKNLLNKYLLDNPDFVIHKEWRLPDESKLMLLRRESINTYLTKSNCIFDSPKIGIKHIKNGINLSLFRKGKFIKSSSLLIDFIGDEFIDNTDVSLANGFFHKSFDEESCYSLSQNISFDFPKEIQKNLTIKARILNQNGIIKNLNLSKNDFKLNEKYLSANSIQMENRISKVEKLGEYLKQGEFKKLFDLVGIINQSDPKQIYLKNAEIIYLQRYEDDQKLEYLYSVLISQILQKKILKASKTIDLILVSDYKNGNAHLAKAIINVYLFKRKEARISINNSKLYEKSLESNKILETIEGLTYLLEIKFINAYQSLT